VLMYVYIYIYIYIYLLNCDRVVSIRTHYGLGDSEVEPWYVQEIFLLSFFLIRQKRIWG